MHTKNIDVIPFRKFVMFEFRAETFLNIDLW